VSRALRWICAATVFSLGAGLSTSARAEPTRALYTADVLDKGRWSFGLMSPLRIGLGKRLEVDTQIVPWLLLSPNASLRMDLGRLGRGIRATGEVGLSVPTGAMWLTQGYLFPTWASSDGRVGWFVVPSAGLWISGGDRGVWTTRLETTVGIPLGESDATPLESYAPLELLFAPLLNRFRTRIGGAYDYALLDWLRARVELNGYMIGKSPYPPRSPFYFSAEAAVVLGLGSRVSLALGAILYNYDQREQVLETGDDGRLHRVGVRSNDIFPTLDLVIRSR